MTHDDIRIPATDGHDLAARVYEPPGPSRATLVALAGVGFPQRALRRVGQWLQANGLRLVTFDYRGTDPMADPGGARSASLTTWATRDAVGALRFVTDQWEEPFVLGHSFGGQSLALTDELHAVRGAILVAAQLGHRHHWSGLARVKTEIFWRVLMPACVRWRDPMPKWLLGAPFAHGVAQEWLAWARSPDWFFSKVPDARERLARFDRSVLAMSAVDDDMAPHRAVSALLAQFEHAPREHVVVRPHELGVRHVGHLGFFRPGAEPLWERWAQFVDRTCDASSASSARHIVPRTGTPSGRNS